ncbi:M4 family metallopeptidase [Ornithinimicrobium flavum]|uniref:M4 family metallopeptidase n=1 Tax=Ornithinimicrobium flavum TaxID=1288636 RepID=UPI00106FB9E2|nr:M4 family metallopeptidase [Ornithinimicrobium flavum]
MIPGTPTTTTTRCGIVPGYLLRRLATAEPDLAPALEFAVRDGEVTRGRREIQATRWPGGHPPEPGGRSDLLRRMSSALPQVGQSEPDVSGPEPLPEEAGPDRRVHDAEHGSVLPGRFVRGEGDPETADVSVSEAFDGLGATWEVLARIYGRDSLDGRGLPLVASVHYGRDYDNAFWDGRQMVFGDGDGIYFNRFTANVDVIAHELAHGLTQYSAGLTYVGQSGALNESVSDVWGAVVRQWVLGQQAREADWLIGAGLFTDRVQGVALRSMAAPGTAYDDPALGRDPQPGHMDDYVRLPHDAQSDNGGVHINSGIPNRAFHLFATSLGGFSWERAGMVWHDTMTTPGLVPRDVEFDGFATATVRSAVRRYGTGSEVEEALRAAWDQVGLPVGSGTPAR